MLGEKKLSRFLQCALHQRKSKNAGITPSGASRIAVLEGNKLSGLPQGTLHQRKAPLGLLAQQFLPLAAVSLRGV